MKEIINNPKKLINITIIFIIISFIATMLRGIIFIVNDTYIYIDSVEFILRSLIYTIFTGFIGVSYYFIKLKSGKNIKLSKMNKIIFINYLITCIMLSIGYIDNIFYKYILYIVLTIYLVIIFFSKRLIKYQNVFLLLLFISYINLTIQNIMNYIYIPYISVFILDILSTIYVIPMLLYFRLYAKSLKEMRLKNE